MFLLQVQTRDYSLQLATEITADAIEQLQTKATKMVIHNPLVKGLTYRIFSLTKDQTGTTHSKMLKQGTINA